MDGNLKTLTAAGDTDTYYAVTTLSVGSHDIKVEYVHNTGDAVMKLDVLPTEQWLAEEYERASSAEEWVHYDTSLKTTDNVLLGSGVSGGASRLAYFSGLFDFNTTADYDFIVRVDDGMKLYIDGQEYLGHWGIDAATAYSKNSINRI